MKIIPKILIIDDEPGNIKLLGSYLSTQGGEIVSSSVAKDALDKINQDDIDAVIIKARMASIDGFEFLKKIRAQERTRLMPVIMILDANKPEDRQRGIEYAANDFISEPFEKDDVLTRVDMLVKLSSLRLLLDEKEKFDYVVENMENGVIILDEKLKIVHINKKAKDLLGVAAYDESFDLFDFTRKSFKIYYEGDLDADVKTKAFTFDIQRPETEQTKPLILSVRSTIIKNPIRQIQSTLFIITDVTQERQEQLAKDTFLSLISHKLRTPLTVISGNVSLLNDDSFGELNEKQKKSMAAICRKLDEFLRLVDKLLAFTAVYSKAVSAPREPIKLFGYLPAVVDSLINPIKNISIEVDFDCSDEDAVINVNKGHFELIIKNLIENSIKFNDKKIIKISVKAVTINDFVEVSITDNGRGIPPEDKDRIFSGFCQVDKYFTGNVEGPGLGLAIIKHLVDNYGGNIKVESHIGYGACFKIGLPIYKK